MKTNDPDPELSSLIETTIGLFKKRFGSAPAWVSAAPGRVNLIGDHVDYNDGLVLPVAIDKYTIAVGAPLDPSSQISTVHSVQSDESFEIENHKSLLPSGSGWQEYIKGVIHGFQSCGATVPPLKILINSTVPTGSGLSSSAALEVSLASMLELACDHKLADSEKALLCQTAEHEFANVPCGIMDQFISVFAKQDHALLLDCRDLTFQQIPFDQSEIALLIINSNATHELANSQYSERRKRCDSVCEALKIQSLRSLDMETLQSKRDLIGELEYRRAKHVVSEIARTAAFAKHITNQQWIEAGQLMYQSHASLSRDYEVSCLELDVLVQLANDIGHAGGVFGSRMTGGGFGGSTVSLVKRSVVDEIAHTIVERFNSDPRTQRSATVFHTNPSQGAFSCICSPS